MCPSVVALPVFSLDLVLLLLYSPGPFVLETRTNHMGNILFSGTRRATKSGCQQKEQVSHAPQECTGNRYQLADRIYTAHSLPRFNWKHLSCDFFPSPTHLFYSLFFLLNISSPLEERYRSEVMLGIIRFTWQQSRRSEKKVEERWAVLPQLSLTYIISGLIDESGWGRFERKSFLCFTFFSQPLVV